MKRSSASSRLAVIVVVEFMEVAWEWQHAEMSWERGREAGITKGEEVDSKRRRDRTMTA